MAEKSLKQTARLEKLKKEGKCKLPANWGKMSVGEQCEYLNDLLKEILKCGEDVDICVTLQCFSTYTYAFVQYTDEDSLGYEPDYVRCHLVRRDPNITLSDLPEQFQKWAIDEYGKDYADRETGKVILQSAGETTSEALENLFYHIILLFYGYECLYLRGDYESYCEENEDD